jgi:hypothetical protein
LRHFLNDDGSLAEMPNPVRALAHSKNVEKVPLQKEEKPDLKGKKP